MTNMSTILSNRKIQPGSKLFGKPAEDAFAKALNDCGFEYEYHPRVFKDNGICGFIPDFLVHGEGKSYIFEIKKQGDDGNAYERAYKYYSPGMLDILNDLGFDHVRTVFTGDMIYVDRIIKQIKQNLLPEQYFLWDYSDDSLKDYLVSFN